MRFKVGDIVEGEADGRWVYGIVRGVEEGDTHDLAVEVFDTKNVGDTVDLHNCECEKGIFVPSCKGWWLKSPSTTIAKSYIINKILSEL